MSFSIKNHRNIPADLVIVDRVTKEPIVNPENGEAVTLKVVNFDSKQFTEAQVNHQLKSQSLLKSKKPGEEPNVIEQFNLFVELYISLIVGWNAAAELYFKEELGEDSTFSTENAKKILSNNDYWWIYKQVEAGVDKQARGFTKQ